METETSAGPPSGRPRTSLLVVLGVVLTAAAVMTLRDSTTPQPPTSNSGRPRPQAAGDTLDPAQLDVRLEGLQGPRPSPDDTERNPFRFRPKPSPPPPPGPGEEGIRPAPLPPEPAGPPLPAPIPLKFIGVTEAPSVGKIAALTDCRHTVQGVEGEIILGRYRIVKIGVESLLIEYVDGTGRTTLRQTGQECVGK